MNKKLVSTFFLSAGLLLGTAFSTAAAPEGDDPHVTVKYRSGQSKDVPCDKLVKL